MSCIKFEDELLNLFFYRQHIGTYKSKKVILKLLLTMDALYKIFKEQIKPLHQLLAEVAAILSQIFPTKIWP